MNNLVDMSSKIYFIGFQFVPLEDKIDLIFDIYNENILSCRLYYRTTSPIPKLLKEDESGIYGELFDRYDLDLSENRIRMVRGHVTELRIVDMCYHAPENDYPVYIYIIGKLIHNEALTIPERLHFYISFVTYLFQENFGYYDSYRKYVNWVTQLNINNDDSEYLDYFTRFRTYHTRRIITSRDGKINFETNTITFEQCDSIGAFEFLQLVNDSNIGDIKEYLNSDNCSENCFISSSDNYPENYFKIRTRKVTVLQKDWDVFKLLVGKYNRYVFLHYDKGNIEFVVPNIVK